MLSEKIKNLKALFIHEWNEFVNTQSILNDSCLFIWSFSFIQSFQSTVVHIEYIPKKLNTKSPNAKNTERDIHKWNKLNNNIVNFMCNRNNLVRLLRDRNSPST